MLGGEKGWAWGKGGLGWVWDSRRGLLFPQFHACNPFQQLLARIRRCTSWARMTWRYMTAAGRSGAAGGLRCDPRSWRLTLVHGQGTDSRSKRLRTKVLQQAILALLGTVRQLRFLSLLFPA